MLFHRSRFSDPRIVSRIVGSAPFWSLAAYRIVIITTSFFRPISAIVFVSLILELVAFWQ